MSFFPGKDPEAGDAYACDAIAHVIVPRTVDLGDGFSVRRALPSARTRMVGPFIFFDHFGPAEFRAGNGLDVRPHPHIGLATVTYLFDGEIMHRDSPRHRGGDQARRGELDDGRARHRAFRAHRRGKARRPAARFTGCRCGWRCRRRRKKWTPALPTTRPPNFQWSRRTAKSCAWWSARFMARRRRCPSCTRRYSPTCYLKAGSEPAARRRSRGARDLHRRRHARHRRRQVRAGPAAGVQTRRQGDDHSRDATRISSSSAARRWMGPRHIWWNFVSSRKERIEQAKAEWKAGHFRKVPGDEIEFIPLPAKMHPRYLLRQIQPDMQLLELLGRRLRRRAHHQVLGALVHREQHHLAQVFLAGEQHDDAVDARRDAAVRRRAERKRVQHAAELSLPARSRRSRQWRRPSSSPPGDDCGWRRRTIPRRCRRCRTGSP